MRVRSITIFSKLVKFETLNFLESKGVSVVLDKKFAWLPFYKEGENRYETIATDIFNVNKRNYVFTDGNLKKSISFNEFLTKTLDLTRGFELNLLSRSAFYERRSIKDIPLKWVIVLLLGGAGFYSILRMLLQTSGFYIP